MKFAILKYVDRNLFCETYWVIVFFGGRYFLVPIRDLDRWLVFLHKREILRSEFLLRPDWLGYYILILIRKKTWFYCRKKCLKGNRESVRKFSWRFFLWNLRKLLYVLRNYQGGNFWTFELREIKITKCQS